ncbi:MAG: SDR family oxidoreductase [Gammaproteobacteria bacterium]|nr:SDR family oxidoreductase [Gammaproteobacteria bacterium]MBU1440835.1 SDR family oxidoreductase [Gammaproteobacteria bacterium]MBU2408093.1 SDR family oxidoreductase [Gammaproteobacteria bacterium]
MHPPTTHKRFEGMSAVVTGAASGLGRDAAIRLAQEGATCVVLMDVSARGLDETAERIGAAARTVVCDASSPEQVAEAWGRDEVPEALDVLMTAAGTIGNGSSIEHCDVAEWDRIFEVNVRGTFLAVKHALPRLRLKKGCIVTFGSTAGLAGSTALGPYSASKGAVVLMTRSLAAVHAAEGIRANCVCPGSIETPMLDATFGVAGELHDRQDRIALYLQRIPFGRFGQASEVTEAALFLASPGASYLTGVALPVDGGRLA